MEGEVVREGDTRSGKVITYHYKFALPGGAKREFKLRLNKRTLNLVQTRRESYPEWAQLGCCKCPNCSLEEAKHPFCPVAANLTDLVDFFRNSVSYEEVDVCIDTEARQYTKHTSLQKALSSLIGIYMATSGCPVMEKLKPMTRDHLPFATLEETTYRAICMYLLAQYFRQRRGQKPDWELKELGPMYDDIRILNQSFCKRLSHTRIGDASINAVVILNTSADFVPISVDQNLLDDLEAPFEAYFR